MIKAIAFDYGGVLEIASVDIKEQILNILKIDKDTWGKTYFSLNHLSNVENTPWEEVIRMTAETTGATKDQLKQIDLLCSHYQTSKHLNEELIEKIKDLKKNYKIALISNYSTKLRTKIQDQNIAFLFDEIIISSEVGFQKPNPEIFKITCKKLGIITPELIFIDDTKRSLEDAEVIGYTPIEYKNNQDLFDMLDTILKN